MYKNLGNLGKRNPRVQHGLGSAEVGSCSVARDLVGPDGQQAQSALAKASSAETKESLLSP